MEGHRGRRRVDPGSGAIQSPIAKDDAFERWGAEYLSFQCDDSIDGDRAVAFGVPVERSILPVRQLARGIGPCNALTIRRRLPAATAARTRLRVSSSRMRALPAIA